MVMLPKQKVWEVHLQYRFCAYYHLNTQNKGIVFIPARILSEGRSPNLPHNYRNIPHIERPEYRENLPITTLTQLRHEAGRVAYEEGVLQPHRSFEYQRSSSQSSAN